VTSLCQRIIIIHHGQLKYDGGLGEPNVFVPVSARVGAQGGALDASLWLAALTRLVCTADILRPYASARRGMPGAERLRGGPSSAQGGAVSTVPLVSIGLPVYNGERFLAQALDSLLGQSLSDLELIISDNASTDRTPDICREYAARDARIRYIRHEVNVGPRRNWNFVAEQARGRYFKWATANDFCDPQMLEKCAGAMSADVSVVLCHALSGVIRIDVLRRTPLIRPYWGGDVVLTAELALHGRIVLLPEVLFFRRMGPQTSSMLLKPRELLKFYYPPASGAKPGREQWRRHMDYFQTILRTPIGPAEKRRALLAGARHAVRDRLLLLEFLPAPARQAARHLLEAYPHTTRKKSREATHSE